MATRSIQLTVNSPYAVVSTRLWFFSTDDKIHIHTFIHSLQVFKTPEEDYEVIPILKSLTPPSPGKLATFPGSPTLFEQWYGFFYVPKGPDK